MEKDSRTADGDQRQGRVRWFGFFIWMDKEVSVLKAASQENKYPAFFMKNPKNIRRLTMLSIIGFLKRIFDICNFRWGTIHDYLYIKQIALLFLAFFGSAFWITPAVAAFSIEYQAPADPTTQGFSPLVVYPPAPQVIEPIANDFGYSAWSISGLALPSQFFYQSGALNAVQKAGINSEGFTLTLRGRILQGSAPAFDAGYNTVIGWGGLDTGSRRYDLALGVNSSGNTVAVLVTYLDGYSPGQSIRGVGPTYVLNDAGYHTYDLVFNPQIQSASLFIDGVERLSGYTGHTYYFSDLGLYVGATSGGGMNFNLVRLTSPAVVPVVCNELIGETLQTCSSYEFSLEQGAQKNDSVRLINTDTVPRTAALEVINPHSDLTISLTEPNSVSIAPGETQTLSIDLNASATPAGVYDDLLLKVTADDGSTLYASIRVNVVPSGTGPLPDLAITADDIGSVTNADGSVTLTATVHNRGTAPASDVQVQFYEFANTLESPPLITQIAPNGIGSTSITLPAPTVGDHLIRAVVDPAGAIEELDDTNNEASRLIPIGSAGPTEGNILVTGSLPATVYTNTLFTLNGRAVYDLYVDGVRYTDYVVKGGAVRITVQEDGGGAEWVYGDVYTDVYGNFSKALQAPATPGTYRITMTVTDKTFVGTRELFFSVINVPATPPAPPEPPLLPSGDTPAGTWEPGSSPGDFIWTPSSGPTPASDLWVFSKNIYFSKNNPSADEEITVFAEIFYWAPSTALVARNVPINVYATYPGSAKVKIGQTLIPSLRVGSPDYGSRYVYATWKNPGDGIYLIEFAIDPSYVETNLLNNAATRAILVGQLAGGAQGAIAGQVTVPLGGLVNVVIQVLDGNGQPIGNAVTDATGYYLVGNVPPGPVQVHIVTPSGYVPDAETKSVTVAQQAVSTVDFHLTPPPPDTTLPVITPTISGTLGNNGWYVSNVTVSWEVTDAESDVTFTVGCGTATVSTDTSGETFTCSATSSGGTTSETVTVKRDATPPTIVGSASPAANANGWWNGAVTVSFTCNDAMAGIATCAEAQTLGGEGANQSASGAATDHAGNSATTTVTGINIDLTPPVVSVTGVTNGASYPLGSVPATSCTTVDTLSGVQTQATLSVTGGNVNGLGNFTASCAGALDKAGNTGVAASVSYHVYVGDTTPPLITPTITGILGSNGWYTSDITINWTVTDGESAITSQSGCDTTTVASDTAGVTLTCSATSGGGTASESVTIKRDAAPPAVNVIGVIEGASYPLGSVPTAECTTTDTLSGVQTQAIMSVTGGDANGLGTFTASCTGAMDKAGNAGTTASATYQVTGAPPSTSIFSAFNMNLLRINQRLKTVFLLSNFTLGPDSDGINPVTEPVTFTIANFTVTVPAGSFRQGPGPVGVYAFAGKINQVAIEALITPLGSNRFGFQVAAYGANFNGTTNPVTVGLMIGNDSGTTSITNAIIR